MGQRGPDLPVETDDPRPVAIDRAQHGEIEEFADHPAMLVAEVLPLEGQCTLGEVLALPQPSRQHEHFGQVGKPGSKTGMIVAIALFVYGDRPSQQRFGIGEAGGFYQQGGDVVEARCNPRMVGTDRGLRDGERASKERLGLTMTLRIQECDRQVVHRSGGVQMVSAAMLLGKRQRPSQQRFGVLQPAGVIQEQGKISQRFAEICCGCPKPSAMANARRK